MYILHLELKTYCYGRQSILNPNSWPWPWLSILGELGSWLMIHTRVCKKSFSRSEINKCVLCYRPNFDRFVTISAILFISCIVMCCIVLLFLATIMSWNKQTHRPTDATACFTLPANTVAKISRHHVPGSSQ